MEKPIKMNDKWLTPKFRKYPDILKYFTTQTSGGKLYGSGGASTFH